MNHTEPLSSQVLATFAENSVLNASMLAVCKASADQLRLDILRVLSNDSYGVLELCQIFDTKQSGLSHHLKVLLKAGMVSTRRECNSIFYRRAHPMLSDVLADFKQSLFQALDRQPLPQEYLSRVNLVQHERALCSQLFFKENADKFRRQQEQIAAYQLYGPNTLSFIKSCLVAEPNTILEVGPGEGLFLAELSKVYQSVYALDNSIEMLEKSKAYIESKKIDNVRFILGDTGNEELVGLNFDCVVLNMVLHHNSSPSSLLQDLSRSIKPKGQLFVTELCHHNQPWVKEACGDLWLGFDPEDLTNWAEQAGFSSGESMFLAQRNGFCVQIRQFIHEGLSNK
ncbi:MAG: ArsR family transcriptional regulator [Gammaproteobacteria bacterium CG22_combo_CG10-13_8_21_14_all_40_8]|nr:MAG: ArsR family transcriptional regulator [Gammaproteobacteria bacterium CG22_combo_CG10-13_8_21_14_all_40_8]